MKGLENHIYFLLYITSNVIALVVLWASWKRERLARLLLFLLFGWASFTNWNEAMIAPQFYLDYADVTFLNSYKNFIDGWFSSHIFLSIVIIAVCQALISIAMLLKGIVFKVGCTGAIIFLLAIAPLGIGSAFPCTVLLAAAIALLLRNKRIDFLWNHLQTQTALSKHY